MNKFKFIVVCILDCIILTYYRIVYFFKNTKTERTWLISERGNDARDNGYWFYKYMISNHPEQPVKYIITKDSSDYHKIRKEDRIIYKSKEHYYYFLKSPLLISAEIMGFSPNEQLYYRLCKHNLFKPKGKMIFLQHGITKDFNQYMLPDRTKLDLFVCGAIPEQKYMIEKYGYSPNIAKLTGFARFDELENLKDNSILIMPTWRKWLKYSNTLTSSKFYEEYMKLLNDEDILKRIEEKNVKLIFYPHVVLQKFLNEFKSKSKNIVLASNNEYDVQELLKKSALLITDYSSVAFDFAYMNKPVIYYQFDVEQYRKEQYENGYYNYKTDGFGPVYDNFKEIKSVILEFIDNNKIFNKYKSRQDKFFKYYDFNNCNRIYDAIMKLVGSDKNE